MASSSISKPYDERSDAERLKSCWNKASKLYQRGEWSSSIVRAATATEIAANIYIRAYLVTSHQLPSEFVDALLQSANGIDGKFKRLITPAAKDRNEWNDMRRLQEKITTVNKLRNQVVHSGRFMNKSEALGVFETALEIAQSLAPNETEDFNVVDS